MKQAVAVVILTLDEEVNIAKAIDSVDGHAPVLVIDSGSTDATRAIAQRRGIEVHQHAFTDYASQRNFALDLCQRRFKWVFFLDADEELTESLWADIEACICADEVDGAYVGYTFWALGHELRHGGFGSASVLRLMRPDRARFARGTNERVDDSNLVVTTLANKLRHDDHKPFESWFHKHIRYAQREARHYLEGDDHRRGLDGFGLRTKAGRMVGIRWAYNKLPLFVRPFANFARSVIVQRAYKDGVPGLVFAGMQGLWYPLVIDLFIYEAKHRNRYVPAEAEEEDDYEELAA